MEFTSSENVLVIFGGKDRKVSILLRDIDPQIVALNINDLGKHFANCKKELKEEA